MAGFVCARISHGKSKKERGANSTHPGPRHREAPVTESTPSRARVGACSVGFCNGLGKFAVFGPARSRSYAKLFWLNNDRRFVFISATASGRFGDRRSVCFGFVTWRDYAGRGAVTMADLPSSGLRPPSPIRSAFIGFRRDVWEKELFCGALNPGRRLRCALALGYYLSGFQPFEFAFA